MTVRHVGSHVQAMRFTVEQVAARRVELAHLDVAQGDSLEHDGRALRAPLHGFRDAASLVARLVQRAVERGVALCLPLARLLVELHKDEPRCDGRLR